MSEDDGTLLCPGCGETCDPEEECWCPDDCPIPPVGDLPVTAPAEDPRGGECQQSDWCGPGSHCLCPPAAGRGDTDSGGESNARRLAWFTDAELTAELTRRALDGA